MLAIKNMEMPNCCWGIKKNGKDYECPIYRACANRKSLVPNCKPSNCPLIEIEELKTGHWIEQATIGEGYKCSECGTQYRVYPINYNYCPYCGSDNREVEDGRN